MLNFGIIGAGIISRSHLDALRGGRKARAVAVADINLSRAEAVAKEYGIRAYSDYKDMLEQEAIDAVIINLPHALHEACTSFCAGKGAHVLVEKPMEVSARACRAMIEVCAREKRVLQVGHVQRYFPENKRAREIIESGQLGRLIMVNEVRTSLYFTEKRPGWFLEKSMSGGGILMNLGAHSLDKIKFLTSSTIEEITGTCGFFREGCDVEGNAQIYVKMGGGVTACITLSGYQDIPVNETTLYFTGGTLKLSTGTGLKIWDGGAFREVDSDEMTNPFEEQLNDFISAILDGTKVPADGAYSMEIITAIEKVYGVNYGKG